MLYQKLPLCVSEGRDSRSGLKAPRLSVLAQSQSSFDYQKGCSRIRHVLVLVSRLMALSGSTFDYQKVWVSHTSTS